ncbi:hypothetical protein BI312_08715 [Xanthomonas citri pv. citri]|nr:hypothetical protein BI314_06150 [Xanthomonas citri pv. citri]QYF46431.1 hypothetical protein HZS93_03778 [Xanthomonas citri]APR14938.1 hypothetical protein BI315_08745 [Xanthomonas citri pv. citri]APR21487.1 hypothetical protein BI316_20130 [Xanthomonas citri pv. citri]APR26285.1 hypothetical protein BJD09_21140 [Xanthomonas citri pv. citri]
MISSLLAATAFGIFFLSISAPSQADDSLGAVSVLGDVRPANPTSKQVWSAHWQQAFNKCRNRFGNTSRSVNLESWDVTAGGRYNDHWVINSVWSCRNR